MSLRSLSRAWDEFFFAPRSPTPLCLFRVLFGLLALADFILLRPPFKSYTWALWLAPPVLLVLGGFFAFFMTRRRPTTVDAAPLTPAEQAAVEALK